MKAGLFLMLLGVAMVAMFYFQITPRDLDYLMIWGGIISFLAGIIALVIGQFAGKRAG